MKNIITLWIGLFVCGIAISQQLEEIEITPEWLSKIEDLAPSRPTVMASPKKVLVFSQHTGFYHWTIPHNNEMLKILAKKSGAFEIHINYDIESFDKKNLRKYDAVIFNNCNPSGPDRDLFADLLKKNTSLPVADIKKTSALYEENMINYVLKGGGLMILHGAITVQNNSIEFSKMTGASFDYHPKQQKMHLREVDKNHPLTKAFKGKGLTHIDEPYFFKNAYSDYNFRPLLYVNLDEIEGIRSQPTDTVNYLAWIKRYGKGRVFYTAPSHNAQTLSNPEFLQFLLDGLQYVVGDLKCDDSPIR